MLGFCSPSLWGISSTSPACVHVRGRESVLTRLISEGKEKYFGTMALLFGICFSQNSTLELFNVSEQPEITVGFFQKGGNAPGAGGGQGNEARWARTQLTICILKGFFPLEIKEMKCCLACVLYFIPPLGKIISTWPRSFSNRDGLSQTPTNRYTVELITGS